MKEEKCKEFDKEVQDAMKDLVWDDCESWYRNDEGRHIANWSFSTYKYWKLTRNVDWNDFNILEEVSSNSELEGTVLKSKL